MMIWIGLIIILFVLFLVIFMLLCWVVYILRGFLGGDVWRGLLLCFMGLGGRLGMLGLGVLRRLVYWLLILLIILFGLGFWLSLYMLLFFIFLLFVFTYFWLLMRVIFMSLFFILLWKIESSFGWWILIMLFRFRAINFIRGLIFLFWLTIFR